MCVRNRGGLAIVVLQKVYLEDSTLGFFFVALFYGLTKVYTQYKIQSSTLAALIGKLQGKKKGKTN